MLELLASEYRVVAQDYLAWTICLAAFIWGAGPERAVAFVWLLLFEIIDGIYHVVSDAGYHLTNVDLFHAALDGVAGIAWISIALFANRNYPLWVAAMQVLAMTAHLARGLVEAVSPIAYLTMVVAPGWFQLIFLGIGLSRHVLRKRKFGPYRDWRVTGEWSRYPAANSYRNQLASVLGYDFFARKDER